MTNLLVFPKNSLNIGLLILLLTTFGKSVGAHDVIYHLSFRGLQISQNERFSRFDLHIRSAMVVGFRRIPIGWHVEIDNDPSWVTQMSGISIVGAANLAPTEFLRKFFSVLRAPDEMRTYPGVSENVIVDGYLELSDGEKQRIVTISNANVTLTR
jgi:hypothetical protein